MNRFCIAIGRTISPCKRKPFGCILASCKQILPIIVVSQVLKSVHWLRKFLLCLPFVLMLVCTVSGVRGRFGNRIQCTKRVCTALGFFSSLTLKSLSEEEIGHARRSHIAVLSGLLPEKYLHIAKSRVRN